MSNNPIPEPERPLLALGEDCADGCHALEDVIPLKLVREDDLRAALLNLKGDLAAQPPVLGLIYRFKQAEQVSDVAAAARKAKDDECKAYLSAARTSLIGILGREPSSEWALAGFANPPANSNAVPNTQAGRLQCLSALAVYLNQHPTYQTPAGGPRTEVTSARSKALHDQLSACREAANAAATAQGTALTVKKAGLQ
jgi:hypothetical protein